MLDHHRRLIYVHIPKTAGNSINRFFGSAWQDHRDLTAYATDLPQHVFKRYYKFATVRNPWDRLLSDYNFQLHKNRPDSSRLFIFKPNGERRSFREWVEMVFQSPFHYASETWGGAVSPGIHRWSPQVDWISLHGSVAVDRVVRLEDLPTGLAAVCSDLRESSHRLPRKNRRFHFHYSWYYDERTRAQVAEYYRKDIEAFDYRFEASPGRRIWVRISDALRQRASAPIEAERNPA